jgi:RNA polymerase sigma factor (sigma-70 family)
MRREKSGGTDVTLPPASGQMAIDQVKELLLRFLQSTDEATSQQLLTRLISTYAEPIIKKIIQSKLKGDVDYAGFSRDSQEAEDLYGEVVLRVINRLQDSKAGPDKKSIDDFGSYVAAVTFHAYNEYMRHKYPLRHSLRTKIRYLLTHQSGFALWESNDREWLCGMAAWQQQKTALGAARLRDMRDGLHVLDHKGRVGSDTKRAEFAVLLANIFNRAGGPVELDDLVNTVGAMLGTKDQQSQTTSFEDKRAELEGRLLDPRADTAAELDQRIRFKRLWAEICNLPERQRTALLLNLRDEKERGAIALLPLTGVCTFNEIARALSLSYEQLAAVWNDLPMDDATIAKRLNVTRQQVINLRKSARERLARRMKNV